MNSSAARGSISFCCATLLAVALLGPSVAYSQIPGVNPQPGTDVNGTGSNPVDFGSILSMVTESGPITLSVAGLGTTSSSDTISVAKLSAGATVRSAYMAAASSGFSDRILANGDISINGTAVAWGIQTTSAISSWNHWADVTAIVKPILDPLGAGTHSLTVGEVDSATIDGSILAVIFDDSTADPKTVQLFFGAQAVTGDSFNIALPAPVDLSDPGLVLDLGLGIAFGFQNAQFSFQLSEVDVNGVRMSSSAGGQDDGEGLNGALLTVGGLGDSNGNPPPFDAPSSASDPDDELYDLIPFVSEGDTNIVVDTADGPPDPQLGSPFDNIFFASFCTSIVEEVILEESIALAPLDDTNFVGADHTVTATVEDSNGAPVVGRQVDFEIIGGPHVGLTGSATTDANGEATFTYTGTLVGIDTIVAGFVDSQQQPQTSNQVTKTWEEVIVLEESIALAPLDDTNLVGADHTVTATVQDSNGAPVVGRQVDFEITAGPHTGLTGSDTTDANGQATFTYTGSSVGADTIVASFTDSFDQTQTSNEVHKTWEEEPPVDTDPPGCALVSIDLGPPLSVQVAFQDTGSGLAAINTLIVTNATVDIPSYVAGTTDPVVVTLTKVDPSQNAFVLIEVADVAGNAVLCDPVLLKLESRPGAPVNEIVTGIPQAEGWVMISNGSPGLPSLEIIVNDQTFQVDDLADGEERTVNVFSAMRSGNDNTFVFRSPDVEGSAVVLISDIPPASALPAHFRRADVNADGRVDIADPISTLNVLFLGDEPPRCQDAADANDDGSVDLADAVFTMSYLFGGGDAPAAPFSACGADRTADNLECTSLDCR